MQFKLFVLCLMLLAFSFSGNRSFATDTSQFDCSSVTQIPQSDCEALVALYSSTNGNNWTDNTNWLQTQPCQWKGVTCVGGGVVQIWLPSNNLTGSLPAELGNFSTTLPFVLSLYDNHLTGNIPPELGNFSSLGYLYLYDNELTGNIPPELGNLTNLIMLRLWNNNLTGNIPSTLGNLENLTNLQLNNNAINGNIPSEIGNLSELRDLRLNNNQLHGQIPPELGNLSQVTFISLGNNNLSGDVPAELSNLSNLDGLFLDNNQLSGPLPQSLVNLNLSWFWFHETNLCEPASPHFQSWLAGISNLMSNGVVCDPPPLEINHSNGAPGSFFTVTGIDFLANITVTVDINSQVLGTVTTNANGELTFLLSTVNADEGFYLVTASSNPRAATGFSLDSNQPIRPQEGEGPVFDVPAGIALTESIFLPVIIRN